MDEGDKVNIEFDDTFKLESYTYGYRIKKRVRNDKGEVTSENIVAYYPRIADCLDFYKRERLKSSGADDWRELEEELSKVEEKIDEIREALSIEKRQTTREVSEE